MKRINIKELSIPEKIYTDFLIYYRNSKSNEWPSELTFLLSYDFPELKDSEIDKCVMFETGLIIFYNNGNPASAYELFETGTETDFSTILPNFSYMRDLKDWKNNPLHYHMMSFTVMKKNFIVDNNSKDINIAVFKKNYKFNYNNRYYFTADFDGYDTINSIDKHTPNIETFSADNENGYYFESSKDTNGIDVEKNDIDMPIIVFNDITSAVRLKCSQEVEKVYISDKDGNCITARPSDIYYVSDSNGNLISNDFIIPAINNTNANLKSFNGILLAVELSDDAKVGSTGVLEVWT